MHKNQDFYFSFLFIFFKFTEEKLGTTEKTELDAHFENLLQRADKTKVWTEKVMRSTECLLQPNPSKFYFIKRMNVKPSVSM